MRKFFRYILLLFLIGLVAAAWYLWPLLNIGAGYAAKHTCSCTFLQNRQVDDIQSNDLNFSVLNWFGLNVDYSEAEVDAYLLGGLVHRTAYFVTGKGCILDSGEERNRAPWEEEDIVLDPIREDSLFFLKDSLALDFDAKAMSIALDSAFVPVAGGGARGLVVLRHGRIIAERYAPGYDENSLLLGWSMTKSVTNALIGMLVKEGKLSLDQTNLFPEWSEDERSTISLQNLLHMSSGLDWNEEYGNTSDATIMLHLEADMGQYAIDKDLTLAPNTEWKYSSGTTNILSKLIRDQFSDDESYRYFVEDSLLNTIGKDMAIIETDQSGTYVGSSYGWATARWWARFGQLYLQDGVWGGQRILPEGWVEFSTQPAPASPGYYGAQIWLQTPELEEAPDDIYAFRGFQDQRVFVIPSLDLVIVRLGHNDDQVSDFGRLINDIIQALAS